MTNSTAIKVKPASGTSTIMYEVDDTNKMSDKGGRRSYGDNGHGEKFVAFIASFGFDVQKKGLTSIIIDGESFDVNFNKVSYLAQNRFTRDWNPRADRCIEIMNSWNSVMAKVHFNVEIDRNKLVAKIQKAIDARKAHAQSLIDSKSKEKRLLTLVRDHYYANPIISTYVEYIKIEKGELNFSIKGAVIVVDASTGVAKEFIPCEEDDGNYKVSDITKWAGDKADTATRANRICSALKGMKPAGKEFAEFSKNVYGSYVRKNKIEL